MNGPTTIIDTAKSYNNNNNNNNDESNNEPHIIPINISDFALSAKLNKEDLMKMKSESSDLEYLIEYFKTKDREIAQLLSTPMSEISTRYTSKTLSSDGSLDAWADVVLSKIYIKKIKIAEKAKKSFLGIFGGKGRKSTRKVNKKSKKYTRKHK